MKIPHLILSLGLIVGFVFSPSGYAQTDVARPKIIGLSHLGLWVKDLNASRQFYKNYLGFDEPYSINNPDGSVHTTWIKINDKQSVELFPINSKTPNDGDSLYHIALETDDAVGMLNYLKSKGVTGPAGKALPDKVGKGKIGNLNFFAEDPDHHIVEIVQYEPEGWTIKHAGKAMPATRIAARISHAGVTVGNLEKSLKFYRDILGMTEFWGGSSNNITLSWVNERLPESRDYIEIMLYGKKPSLDRVHTMNHMCLEVPSIYVVDTTLKTRTLPAVCKKPTAIKAGVNRKRQINCFDPDGTRVEIMEASTVDGKPTPSSATPPPTEND